MDGAPLFRFYDPLRCGEGVAKRRGDGRNREVRGFTPWTEVLGRGAFAG